MSDEAWPEDGQDEVAGQEAQQPETVSKADYEALKQNYERQSQQVDRLTDSLGQVASGMQYQQPVQAKQEEPGITPEEIEQALQEGTGADKFMKLVDSKVKSVEARNNQMLAALAQKSFGSTAELVKAQTLGNLEHYKDYQGQIDSALAGMSLADRADPEKVKGVYDYVVGTNHDEIFKKKMEAYARGEGAQVYGGQNSRDMQREAEPEVKDEDLFSDPHAVRKALHAQRPGQTLDDWLGRRGISRKEFAERSERMMSSTLRPSTRKQVDMMGNEIEVIC